MKFILVLTVLVLFVSSTFPVAAHNQTEKRKPATVTHRSTESKRRRARNVIVKISPLAVTTSSGLTYVVTRRGEGRLPRPGENVMVQYTGLLTSGSMFDTSLDKGQPYVFELGAGHVIKGWDEGIAKLHVGDQATFIIPSTLGYGEKGRGPIPPNATLIFVVELVGIEEKPTTN
jgi:FKBP-type peptidyl-prolyl cis-trans isomerase